MVVGGARVVDLKGLVRVVEYFVSGTPFARYMYFCLDRDTGSG